jgi:hypothetical protein
MGCDTLKDIDEAATTADHGEQSYYSVAIECSFRGTMGPEYGPNMTWTAR